MQKQDKPKKVIILCLIFLIINICFIPIIKGNNEHYINSISEQLIIDETSHIIRDPSVPYVGQTTSFYCAYAVYTMIVQYYGYNASLHEILHHAGVGYGLSYCRFLNNIFFATYTPARIINSGNQLGLILSNRGFLLNLYNLSYNYIIIPEQSPESRWHEYWMTIKETIQNDIPVKVTVDPYSLPYLREIWNISDNSIHGDHTILLVGYNESNQTVCYNDPAAAFWDEAINGTYTFIDIEVFRGAMVNCTGLQYMLEIIKLQDDFTPTSAEYRFEIAYERNIRKMMGVHSAYSSDFQHPYMTFRGINAVKIFKRDMQIGLTYRLLTFCQLININYTELEYLFSKIIIEKHNASEYFLEHKLISLNYTYVGLLLQQESNCWNNVTNLILQVNEIGRNNSFFKTWFLTNQIIKDIIQGLNQIISIEEEIIKK